MGVQIDRKGGDVIKHEQIISTRISERFFHLGSSEIFRSVVKEITFRIFLASLRLVVGGIAPLFTIYSEEGDEQLAITVGREVSMYYEDTDGLPEEDNYISFDTSVGIGE